MLTQKRITKLLNPKFRKQILSSISPEKVAKYKIDQYARYCVDSCILNRDKSHENDKDFGYGFSPVNFLCAVLKDGTIDKRFFEFNSVNHFLREKDGDSAVEVVKCILIEWVKESKEIVDFDIDKIDAELARIEADYIAAQEKDKKVDEMGKKIKEVVEPIIEASAEKDDYEAAVAEMKPKLEEALNKVKESKEIFTYVLDFSRNKSETISAGLLFVDIGFKLEEKDELVVLVCSRRPKVKKSDAGEEKANEEDQI